MYGGLPVIAENPPSCAKNLNSSVHVKALMRIFSSSSKRLHVFELIKVLFYERVAAFYVLAEVRKWSCMEHVHLPCDSVATFAFEHLQQ